jgi:hypothetical protein
MGCCDESNEHRGWRHGHRARWGRDLEAEQGIEERMEELRK